MTNPEMNAVNKAPIDYIDALARIADLEASIARLVEALSPFAEANVQGHRDPLFGRNAPSDELPVIDIPPGHGGLVLGDFRRARQALSDHLQESASVERAERLT